MQKIIADVLSDFNKYRRLERGGDSGRIELLNKAWDRYSLSEKSLEESYGILMYLLESTLLYDESMYFELLSRELDEIYDITRCYRWMPISLKIELDKLDILTRLIYSYHCSVEKSIVVDSLIERLYNEAMDFREKLEVEIDSRDSLYRNKADVIGIYEDAIYEATLDIKFHRQEPDIMSIKMTDLRRGLR